MRPAVGVPSVKTVPREKALLHRRHRLRCPEKGSAGYPQRSPDTAAVGPPGTAPVPPRATTAAIGWTSPPLWTASASESPIARPYPYREREEGEREKKRDRKGGGGRSLFPLISNRFPERQSVLRRACAGAGHSPRVGRLSVCVREGGGGTGNVLRCKRGGKEVKLRGPNKGHEHLGKRIVQEGREGREERRARW